MKYKIAIHRTDEGISVSVPALPGCWSEGDTEEEALANMQDAIREYLAAPRGSLPGCGSPRSRCAGVAGPRIPGVNHLDAIRALGKAGF